MEALGDLGGVEEPDVPFAALFARLSSISNRHRLANLVNQVFIILRFVKACVPCLSHRAGHFANIISYNTPRECHLLAPKHLLSLYCRRVDSDEDAYIGELDVVQHCVRT